MGGTFRRTPSAIGRRRWRVRMPTGWRWRGIGLRFLCPPVRDGRAGAWGVALVERSAVGLWARPFLVSRYPKPRGRKRDPRELLQPAGRLAFAGRVLGEELARLRERRRTVCQTVPPAERKMGPDLGSDPLLLNSMDKFRTAAVNSSSAFGSDPLLPGSLDKGEGADSCFGGLPEVVAIEPLAEQALGARRVRPW